MSQPKEGATPTPPPPQTPAPAAYAQWPTTSAAIPIDPALQTTTTTTPAPTTAAPAANTYAHYQPYSYYSGHYQYPTAATSTPQPVQPTRAITTTPAQPVASTSNTNSGGMDTSDVATLNDALGSAGVDLRAEEESLQRASDNRNFYSSYNAEDRSRKQPPRPAFDTHFLGTTMRTIAAQHKVTRVSEESVNYLALALRARLQDLLTAMISAAHHRTDTQFDRPASLYEDGQPMWSILVRSDVARQLSALEKVEQIEETRIRKERKERQEMAAAHAAHLAAQVANQQAQTELEELEAASGKKRKKKDGPGVTARNMPEDVRKKMSNAVASQAAGISSKYSWMNAAASSQAAAAKPKPAAQAQAASPGTTTPTSSWARPYVSVKKAETTSAPQTPSGADDRTAITMRDAMFVVEKERGHGGGRGSARGWT
ncbi:hypothetical protein CYLTODRAFT_403322 [Cylindrobasidium torrendii FP15055 ss-10]|uniref:Transcription initiation factor TFIID subunit 4 n=1 Tax=Cylindrobasidium torrendii FP15055 ss-10 TaxID=1314674 RepID=A0A0D7AZQ2_9AGAR|nr:hypothetical protein CYLTODRAFT_403322 [Cylindrobasidium torrendii FP15055 ss-10]